ncbi:dynein axonemal assembly factor 6-like isoform X1 [Haliotis rufescens]|uniref:dynein axonemal assembly factor 6-like isoform X1 n=1 Tax=Haliotis rufescens TaxID=6454 RepID=UPI00201E8D9A|nr:dynein axonemal assembly factor 6-like isoform X1 [Haliotis rufescens]XP_046354108.2 dynein axonemal assembly factor 6-like isoform X1 [Haliotis rufescens]XP_046354109.2 dynein axonemal assembly factor 6-like isoform X1 [Haliotis rufescens]
MNPVNVAALVDLLHPEKHDSDSEDDMPSNTMAKMTPADIIPKKTEIEEKKSAAGPKIASKDIWDEEEVPEGSEFESVYDPRPQPDFDIVYKQAVTSEDMFLGMGNKTPSSASCEDMVVKIKLPDCKMADVQLDVKAKFLDCRTPKYKLGLHLPHPVDHKNGKAQWESSSETLVVTLHMMREYDFMNF